MIVFKLILFATTFVYAIKANELNFIFHGDWGYSSINQTLVAKQVKLAENLNINL